MPRLYMQVPTRTTSAVANLFRCNTPKAAKAAGTLPSVGTGVVAVDG